MKILIILMSLVISLEVWSFGGFEKQSMWSAKVKQRGGAVSSITKGAESIRYNPAGIGKSSHENNLLIGISDMTGNLQAPVSTNETVDSKNQTGYPLGILYSRKLNDKWAVGLGVYAEGGVASRHNRIDFSNIASGNFNHYTDVPYSKVGMAEYNLSASYKLNENWSFGASFRGQHTEAEFSKVTLNSAKNLSGSGVPDGTPLALSTSELKNLEGESWGSFSLGTQFEKDSYGFGLHYRSEKKISLDGNSNGNLSYSNTGSTLVNVSSGGAITPTVGNIYSLNGGVASVETYLPQQFSLDGHYHINEGNSVFLGYTWTNYSRIKKIKVSGTLTNSLTGAKSDIPDITTNWEDMHDYKIAWENTNLLPVSFGLSYNYSSQVTNSNYASDTLIAPAPHHTYAIGLGKVFNFKESSLGLNLAYEMISSSKSGRTEAIEIDNTTEVLSNDGNFETNVRSWYLDISYNF